MLSAEDSYIYNYEIIDWIIQNNSTIALSNWMHIQFFFPLYSIITGSLRLQ